MDIQKSGLMLCFGSFNPDSLVEPLVLVLTRLPCWDGGLKDQVQQLR